MNRSVGAGRSPNGIAIPPRVERSSAIPSSSGRSVESMWSPTVFLAVVSLGISGCTEHVTSPFLTHEWEKRYDLVRVNEQKLPVQIGNSTTEIIAGTLVMRGDGTASQHLDYCVPLASEHVRQICTWSDESSVWVATSQKLTTLQYVDGHEVQIRISNDTVVAQAGDESTAIYVRTR